MNAANQHLQHAFLYIAIDMRHMDMCKIGLTTQQDPSDRIRAGITSNPYYAAYNIYDLRSRGITITELRALENYVRRKSPGQVIHHFMSDCESEWIEEAPWTVAPDAEYFMARALSINLGEDYEPLEGAMEPYRFEFRPSPLSVIGKYDYERCQEYVDYLHLCEEVAHPRPLRLRRT